MSDELFKQAVGAWRGLQDAKQNSIEWQPATSGDGKGNVRDPDNLNNIFVRLSDSSSAISVLCLGMTPVDGVRIMLIKKPEMPNVWQVSGQNDERLDAIGINYSAAGIHSWLHQYLAPDQVNIDWRQIENLRVYHDSTLAAFTVGVKTGLIPRAGADLEIIAQTLDLSAAPSHIPASGALYVLIYLNSAGVLSALDGTLAGGILDLDLTDIPDTPAGGFRLAAVRLYDGQAAIREDTGSNDVVDLRWPQEKLAASIGTADITLSTDKMLIGVANVATEIDTNGTGNPVRTTSPILVTPNLGTPSALVATNVTGLPLAGHVDMATASLYYRKSAGNGPPEVNTLATLKTDLGSMPAAAHNLLSAIHGDTTAASAVLGDMITAQAGPVWARLALGGIAGSFVTRDATDVAWSTGALAITANKTLTVSDSATIANAAITLANSSVLTLTTSLTNQVGAGVLAWPAAGATLTIPATGQALVHTSPTVAGYIPFFSGTTGVVTSDAGLFWDNTHKRLGINNVVPESPLHVAAVGDSQIYSDAYSTMTGHSNYWFSRRSHSNALGTLTQTVDTESLGTLYFQGVNTSSAWAFGARINVTQDGVAGTYVPTTLEFSVFSSTAEYPMLKLYGSIGKAIFLYPVGISINPATQFHVSGTAATPGTTNKGVALVSCSNVGYGLALGGYAATPYGMFLQAIDTRIGYAGTAPLLLNPISGNVAVNTALAGADTYYALNVAGSIAHYGMSVGTTERTIATWIATIAGPDASRIGTLTGNVWDTSARQWITVTSIGGAAAAGFLGSAAVVQQGATIDLGVVLSNFGFRAAGTAYPITTSGAVSFGASQQGAYATTAVDLTLTGAHHFVTVTAACTITLPTAIGCAGREYIISALVGSVIVDGAGSETIQDETTQTLREDDTMVIKSNGIGWRFG